MRELSVDDLARIRQRALVRRQSSPPAPEQDNEILGMWSREQLERMDKEFVDRVEAAFEAGLESRRAADLTVGVQSPARTDLAKTG